MPTERGIDRQLLGLRADAVAELTRARPPRAGGTRVVGIDGPSGSGKTTYADAVRGPLDCSIVHLDDLVPGWDGMAQAPQAVHDEVLEPLAQGRSARYRRYDWVAGQYAEWHDVAAEPYLIIEGVGAGARLVAPYLSVLVWVEAPKPLRFKRGIERDGEAYRPHWERWARQEEAHYRAENTRDRADVRIEGAG